MFSTDRRLLTEALMFWCSIVTLVIALKQFYSVASAEQLLWMLWPLVRLLELCSELSFIQLPSGIWLDEVHRISIVKSCAGVNFLIISLLGYVWRWRDERRRARLIIVALTAAWLTALLANTLRIIISVHGNDVLTYYLHISEADIHRLIGIVVYFLCLSIQLICFRLHECNRALIIAALVYLTVTLFLPWLRAWTIGSESIRPDHIQWVVAIPLGTILLVLIITRLLRH